MTGNKDITAMDGHDMMSTGMGRLGSVRTRTRRLGIVDD
jgi:hypothetical protein